MTGLSCYTTVMNKPKCPKCAGPLSKSYVSDMSGEVIGLNLYCVNGDWEAVGNW